MLCVNICVAGIEKYVAADEGMLVSITCSPLVSITYQKDIGKIGIA